MRRAHAAVCDRDARVEGRYAWLSGDARARAGLEHGAMCVSAIYRVSLVSLGAGYCVGCCWRTMRASGGWICSELGWSELRDWA